MRHGILRLEKKRIKIGMKRIFTFGHGQEHRGKYVIVHGKDREECRNKMVKQYGYEWAFVNDEHMLERMKEKGFTQLEVIK